MKKFGSLGHLIPILLNTCWLYISFAFLLSPNKALQRNKELLIILYLITLTYIIYELKKNIIDLKKNKKTIESTTINSKKDKITKLSTLENCLSFFLILYSMANTLANNNLQFMDKEYRGMTAIASLLHIITLMYVLEEEKSSQNKKNLKHISKYLNLANCSVMFLTNIIEIVNAESNAYLYMGIFTNIISIVIDISLLIISKCETHDNKASNDKNEKSMKDINNLIKDNVHIRC